MAYVRRLVVTLFTPATESRLSEMSRRHRGFRARICTLPTSGPVCGTRWGSIPSMSLVRPCHHGCATGALRRALDQVRECARVIVAWKKADVFCALVTEVGFNAMSTRLGNIMQNTETLNNNNRPAGTNLLFVGWETLTNAGTP